MKSVDLMWLAFGLGRKVVDLFAALAKRAFSKDGTYEPAYLRVGHAC